MQRRLTVTRIFPLGQYKNIQLTNEMTFDNEEVTEETDIKGLYSEMIYEVYATFYQHAKEAMAFEGGGTIDEKWNAYLESREE